MSIPGDEHAASIIRRGQLHFSEGVDMWNPVPFENFAETILVASRRLSSVDLITTRKNHDKKSRAALVDGCLHCRQRMIHLSPAFLDGGIHRARNDRLLDLETARRPEPLLD